MQKRDISLDLLRAVAVILVLGRHLVPPDSSDPAWVRHGINTWMRGGWVGVDLFFVLSGFLIGGLLFREHKKYGSINIGRFYIRRGFKIYPPFFFLTLMTVVWIKLRVQSIPKEQLAADVFFVQSYFPGLWPHAWSLSVEEHFYLALPMLLWLLLRARSERADVFRPVPWIAAAVACLLLLLRLINSNRTFDYQTHLYPTHLRLDSLLAGVALSYLYHYRGWAVSEFIHRYRLLLMFIGAALLSPAFIFPLEDTPFIYTGGLTLFFLGGGLLIMGSSACKVPRNPITSAFAYMGTHSYSIYLWHLAVNQLAYAASVALLSPAISYYVFVVSYLIGSIIIGIVLAKVVEIPAIMLRDRWFPSRVSGPIPAP